MITKTVPKSGTAVTGVDFKVGYRSMIIGVFRVYVRDDVDTTMFNSNNPYGYALNVSHPRVGKWYARYKAERKLPSVYPISDEERMEFEVRILHALGIAYDVLDSDINAKKVTVGNRPGQPSTIRG